MLLPRKGLRDTTLGFTISCDLMLREQHPTDYWWPLVFDVLWRHQFSFDNPCYQPHHQGGFLRFTADADGAMLDADPIDAASFRTLWDTIYTASQDGTVTVAPNVQVTEFRTCWLGYHMPPGTTAPVLLDQLTWPQ
jgi:hypothetical protein